MPRPPRLDRRTIVTAAVELLDERGLDDLSMYERRRPDQEPPAPATPPDRNGS